MSQSASDRQLSIDAIFNAKHVVVMGASAKRSASGNEAIRNLLSSGFPRQGISVVHPTAGSIDGFRAVDDVRKLETVPDVALVSLPPRAVTAALLDLEEIGCRAAVVPTSGFDEVQESELRTFLRSARIAVHGNNCMGVLNVADSMPLWIYEGVLTDLPVGPIALVSQSGSATFLARAVEGIGFSRVLSTGNEIDLSSTDYLRWLASDDETTVVGLVVESIKDEKSFTEAVRALREAGKPLIVLKVGRTEAGGRATFAHTGALVTSHEAYTGYFDSLDVPVVGDYDQFAVSLQLAASGVRSEGGGVLVITDSGGEAALAADLATDLGLSLPELSEATQTRLEELIPGSIPSNPFDAGATPASDDAYAEAYLVAASDPAVDSVMVILEGHAAAPESETRANADMLVDAIECAANAGRPVIATSSSATATSPLFAELLGDIPLARGIANSLVALRATSRNRRPIADAPDRPGDLPSQDSVDLWQSQLRAFAGEADPEITQDILRSYGIPIVASVVAKTATEAVAWAQDRYPVVAKVQSRDVAHRSDIGGVVIDVSSESALIEAIARIESNVLAAIPTALIEGFEVQEQVSESFEAVVGLTSDPVLGSVVVAGSGGVLVELLADTRSARVPVTPEGAAELLQGTVLHKRLAGYRNLAPRTPTTALCDLIHRVSWLAHDFRGTVTELDLNPVLVEYGSGSVRVVDSLMSLRRAPHTVPASQSPKASESSIK